MSRTIVVGVDGSDCSDAAVERAIELAAGLGDRLVVAYAVEPPFRSVGEEWQEAQKALEELGSPIVDRVLARAQEASGGRGGSGARPAASHRGPPRSR